MRARRVDYPTPHGERRPSPRALVAATAAAATLAAGVVALTGGGESFWFSLPLALLVSAFARGRWGSGLSAAAVVGTALAASVAVGGAGSGPGATAATAGGRPSLTLALLVPALSVAVLGAVRERLVREREALRVSAATDPLTGAANRRSLLTRIEYEIARHRRGRRSFAVVMLDLDGFKQLNDRFGHAAGDDLLREVATALRSVLRDQDTVARIGGDEFCVLAPETDAAGVHRLAGRVMTAVGRVAAGLDVLGASPGVAVFPRDGRDASSLLQTADERLIDVKRRRRAGRSKHRAA